MALPKAPNTVQWKRLRFAKWLHHLHPTFFLQSLFLSLSSTYAGCGSHKLNESSSMKSQQQKMLLLFSSTPSFQDSNTICLSPSSTSFLSPGTSHGLSLPQNPASNSPKAIMSNADFHRLSGTNIFCEATEYTSLIPKLSASHDQVEVSAIQVTVFPNHGFSIGVHAVLDGKSIILFAKSWAPICRSLGSGHRIDGHYQSNIFLQLPPEMKPIFDRDYVKDSADVGTTYSNQWLSIDGSDNRSLVPWEAKKIRPGSVRGTFQTPREKIQKLKQLKRVQNMANKDIFH